VRDILVEKNVSDEAITDMVIIPQVLTKEAEEACFNNGLQDVINSNRLSARVMASTCQSPELCAVYSELLSESGARFCIRQLKEYLSDGDSKFSESGNNSVEVSFSDAVAAAAACGEIVIGWSWTEPTDNNDTEGGSVRWELNPKDKTTPRPWTQGDSLVVIGSQILRNPRSLLQGAVNSALMPKLRGMRALRTQASLDSLESLQSGDSADALKSGSFRRGKSGNLSPVAHSPPPWSKSRTIPRIQDIHSKSSDDLRGKNSNCTALWRKSRLMSFPSFSSNRTATKSDLTADTPESTEQNTFTNVVRSGSTGNMAPSISTKSLPAPEADKEESPVRLEDFMIRRASIRVASPTRSLSGRSPRSSPRAMKLRSPEMTSPQRREESPALEEELQPPPASISPSPPRRLDRCLTAPPAQLPQLSPGSQSPSTAPTPSTEEVLRAQVRAENELAAMIPVPSDSGDEAQLQANQLELEDEMPEALEEIRYDGSMESMMELQLGANTRSALSEHQQDRMSLMSDSDAGLIGNLLALARLHRAGDLTAQEYAAAKAALLTQAGSISE